MRVLIYGGKGALGGVCVSHMKKIGHWVCSVDFSVNEEADENVLVMQANSMEEQSIQVIASVREILKDKKVDNIFCVAGGWAGGNASSKDFVKNCELTWKQSVWSSTIAASLAAQFLNTKGMLVLTGAQPALDSTASMIGYGMAKAAVHHLTKSLAANNSGMPTDSCVAAILPITLDTPMNRKFMPNADFSTWTPLETVAGMFAKWTQPENRPTSGSLIQLVTKNGDTQFMPTL